MSLQENRFCLNLYHLMVSEFNQIADLYSWIFIYIKQYVLSGSHMLIIIACL